MSINIYKIIKYKDKQKIFGTELLETNEFFNKLSENIGIRATSNKQEIIISPDNVQPEHRSKIYTSTYEEIDNFCNNYFNEVISKKNKKTNLGWKLNKSSEIPFFVSLGVKLKVSIFKCDFELNAKIYGELTTNISVDICCLNPYDPNKKYPQKIEECYCLNSWLKES